MRASSTGIGVRDIVGTVTECAEHKGNGSNRQDPRVSCSDWRRHTELIQGMSRMVGKSGLQKITSE
jgi:hypothetical protein